MLNKIFKKVGRGKIFRSSASKHITTCDVVRLGIAVFIFAAAWAVMPANGAEVAE